MSLVVRAWVLACAALVLGGCVGLASQAYRPQPPEIPAEAARVAASLKGEPYRWGGDDPGGFDCSGLVHYAYARAGLEVPRTARQQYEAVRPLYVHQLVPGDLVFFTMPGKFLSHVGIYLGDQRFVHALNANHPVLVSRLDDHYWQHRLVRAGALVR